MYEWINPNELKQISDASLPQAGEKSGQDASAIGC